MNESTLTNPTMTEDELATALNKAVHDGNLEEIDRLMAVETQPKEETPEEDTPADPQEEVAPAEKDPDDKTNVEPSPDKTVEEEEQKDEAADQPDAASTPDEGKDDTVDVQALTAELHRLRSDVGRMPYLRRRTQELERELRDLKLNRTAASPDANAAPNNATKAIPESLQKRLNALKDIDPDLAETLEETINALRTEAATHANTVVKEVVEAEDERADEAFLQEQYQLLVSQVPQAPEIFRSTEWKTWKEGLTPARRAFASSIYADEVSIAIQAFLNDMQARVQQNGTPAQVTTQPPQVDPEATPVVSKVQEARNRKMSTAAGTPTSVAAKSGSVQLSEEQQFSEFYKKVQKDNHLG